MSVVGSHLRRGQLALIPALEAGDCWERGKSSDGFV